MIDDLKSTRLSRRSILMAAASHEEHSSHILLSRRELIEGVRPKRIRPDRFRKSTHAPNRNHPGSGNAPNPIDWIAEYYCDNNA
jgi:hypothetical protein